MRSRHSLVVLALLSLACAPDQPTSNTIDGPLFAKAAPNPDDAAELVAYMDAVNASLEAEGADYRIAVAEYIAADGVGDEVGATLLQKDVGNKHLPHDFVPFDPRRAWSGAPGSSSDNITFAVDQTGDAVPVFGGATAAQTTAAIRSAMATWDAASCSDLPITENLFAGDIGRVAFLNGLGGSPAIVADVQHAGWRDINFAGGILGATFTFIFVSGGAPTDIDGNGLLDVAFREIYYDPSFIWRVDGGNIDVESVALHEAGHGLSQAHFGNIFRRHDGTFDASPRAVMNAFYQSAFRALTGTDNGGHCSNWASWPNN